jgi:hypothetical protein
MGRFTTRTTDFTIEDVNDWLAGSAEAEKKVWIDCQFLFAMQKMTLKKVKKNFYDKKQYFILHYFQTYEVDLDAISMDTILEIMDYLRNHPKTFPSRPQFIEYIKETAFFRLRDTLNALFNKMQQTESHDRLLINKQNDSKQLYSDIILVDETTPYEQYIQLEINAIALLLIKTFKESPILSSKNALKRHLCILIQVAGDEKPVIVVIFLWKGDVSKALRKEAQERTLYHQQTWSSYNRRLSFHFKEFIQTEKGQELFDRLLFNINMKS